MGEVLRPGIDNVIENVGKQLVEFSITDLIIKPFDESAMETMLNLEMACFGLTWTDELFKSELEGSAAFNLCAWYRDQLIAISLNHFVSGELHVIHLGVLPQFRSLGIGRRLFSEVISQAKLKGLDVASLEVRKSNTIAQRMYASAGFVQVGERKRYYADCQEDAYVFSRDFQTNSSILVDK